MENNIVLSDNRALAPIISQNNLNHPQQEFSRNSKQMRNSISKLRDSMDIEKLDMSLQSQMS